MKFPLRDEPVFVDREPSNGPPAESQYPKGTSGNPHRRAAPKLDLRASLIEELAKPLPKGASRLAARPMPLDNVARAIVVGAAKKDKRALRRIRKLVPPDNRQRMESVSPAEQAVMAEKLVAMLHAMYSVKVEVGYYRGVAASWPEGFWPTINGEPITSAERDYLLERACADPNVQKRSSTFTTPIPGGRDFDSGRLVEQLTLPGPAKDEG